MAEGFAEAFGIGDGVSISVPSAARCLIMSQSAHHGEFDVGEGWQLTGFFDDSAGPDVEGFHIELQRPFWNKCTIDIQIGDQTQSALVGGG